ncbi:MAG TPA: alanine dehydrogenase [Thermoanaerobacterales bacterium]|uniref:alanine dehydrogenase n=1 Tax=Tepidanaerobacter sp. GT38 TaxID=2722793 RepID=UPI0017BB29E1|nr:alanine dehydrogenase [Tepidanaerobacter sp. GT38]MCG1013297.1 alanine dehydrogenase [Tepidanaerobacter sp. GT38]HHY42676.1 alanine dehydrogenase [Thermoanaerobacterales bacterium]
MIIGVVKELKEQENRVAITPAGVDALTACGHKVLIEQGAGLGSGFTDESYKAAGAEILNNASDVWKNSEMIVKVKEPHESEYEYLRPDLVYFAYLHLAADINLTKVLMESGVTAIAYETVQRNDKSLPLLTPMSEVAGRMAIQEGAIYLEKTRGGKGILLEGVPGVTPASVVIVGAGTVGTGAIRRAMGLGARVTVLDINVDRLRYLEDIFMGRIETLYSNRYNLSKALKHADLVVGAVLIPGAKTPKLITEEMVKKMQPGSVIVDVAIDQGGCVETIERPTTHANPVFVKHGVIHYAVSNIPGAVPRTSTLALTNATLPYILEMAKKGWKQAVLDDEALAKGVNVMNGKITNKAVAEAHNLPYYPLEEVMKN